MSKVYTSGCCALQAVLEWEAQEVERQKMLTTAQARAAEAEEADGEAGAGVGFMGHACWEWMATWRAFEMA